MNHTLFDPLDPEFLASPYPVYTELRNRHPVFFSDRLDAWILTRHADCSRVLSDSAAFTVDPSQFGEEVAESTVSLQTLDPPRHRELRHEIIGAMRSQDLGTWQAGTEAIAASLLEGVLHRPFDFVTEFAEPLALRSMSLFFGVQGHVDETSFRSISRDIVLGMDAGLEPSRVEPCELARVALNNMIQDWFGEPGDTGLLTDLHRLGRQSDTPPVQLVNSARMIFHAGYSSLSSFLGNAIGWLARHEMLHAATLRAADSAMVNELFRLDSSVQAVFRMCAENVEIGDQRLRRGAGVIALVGAANHDPQVFSAPDTAHFGRNPNLQLSLGRGVHACLGGHMAGRVVGSTLRLLGRHCTRIHLEAPPVQRPTATLRGLESLLVRAGRQPAVRHFPGVSGVHSSVPAKGG